MAAYKVWLTVKDAYGNTKEVDGGNINIDLTLDGLTSKDIDQIGEALPFEDYLKKADIDTELSNFATDQEVTQIIQNNNTIKYTDFIVQAAGDADSTTKEETI